MCLGETPLERVQETIRLAARLVRQRCSIPWGVGGLVRSLGGGDRGQGRLLVVARLCSSFGVCALVGLGDALQVSSTLRVTHEYVFVFQMNTRKCIRISNGTKV